jgi:hypothetical protein
VDNRLEFINGHIRNLFRRCLHFHNPLYPVRNNAPLEFLTGFTASLNNPLSISIYNSPVLLKYLNINCSVFAHENLKQGEATPFLLLTQNNWHYSPSERWPAISIFHVSYEKLTEKQ